jgi:chromosomal replication initiator protein
MDAMSDLSTIDEIWEKSSSALRQRLNADTYERWIANIVPVRIEGKSIVLGVSNDLFNLWLSANYKDLIAECMLQSCGCKLKIVFESGHEIAAPPPATEPKAAAAPGTGANGSAAQDKQQAPPRNSSYSHSGQEHPFNGRFVFDSFVVGENNRFAHGACRAVASAPGTAYNPLFVHSPTGLGKTHLLQAVAQEALKLNRRAKVEYLYSEDFCNQYIDALSRKALPAFRNRFRSVDVLLIDDVHFFGGKEGLQEEFFHTFNALYNGHKQIVLASDRPPHEIGGLERRLVSRFEWGLITDIQAPDLETRIAILHRKQDEHKIKLEEEVLHYLAARLKSNVRRLEGALVQLVSYSSVTGKKIGIETTEKLLSTLFNEEASAQVSVEHIQRTIADYYDIRFSDMSSKRRPANIAFPRQVAMFFSRRLTELSLPAIAEQFNRNHATVLHAISTVENKLERNPDFRREIAQLERRLKV